MVITGHQLQHLLGDCSFSGWLHWGAFDSFWANSDLDAGPGQHDYTLILHGRFSAKMLMWMQIKKVRIIFHERFSSEVFWTVSKHTTCLPLRLFLPWCSRILQVHITSNSFKRMWTNKFCNVAHEWLLLISGVWQLSWWGTGHRTSSSSASEIICGTACQKAWTVLGFW